ncbi:hypothetical protein ACFWDI_26560 [Streptomyces sp. NPDC060064]|uniref:hypothetical protein n=1 Tax=Streptomyces sp. NPDC060064 TaxID=3347049 RepID=UPI0036BBEBFA
MVVNRLVPDVALVAVTEDAGTDRSLRDFLKNAGLRLVDEGPADVVVVLISVAAVDDPEWREQVEQHQDVRLVPVRIDGVRSSRAPEHLRPINWVTLDPASPVTAFGTVLVAALSDPEQMRELRDLRGQTEAWIRASRGPEHLIADHRQAAEAHGLMAVLREDGYIDTSGPVGEFVETSYRHTAQKRTKKRRRRIVGTVLAVAMLLFAAAVLPRILKTKGTDFNALVSFGDPASARVMPEWMSLQSASLLLRGNAQQKVLARQTLASLLSVPWSLRGPAIGIEGRREAVDGVASLPGGRRVALMVRDVSTNVENLALYDVHEGTVPWQLPLGPGYMTIDAGPDGRTVVAVGKRDVAVVDTWSRKVRRLARTEGANATVRMTRRGDVILAEAHRLLVGSSTHGRFHTVGGRYDSLLSVEPTTDGGARALVTAGPGRYQLLNALTGAVLASADTGKPILTAGAVAPDEAYAVFMGADRQMWTMRPGRSPAPTGIAVPERTTTVGLLAKDRVVVGGQDQPTHVIRLTDGSDLGVVCRDMPQLDILVMSSYGDLLGCRGPYGLTFWQAPAGPRHALAGDRLHTGIRAAHGSVVVQSSGDSVHMELTGHGEATMKLFTTDVEALALSPDGSQVVAATARGDVAVVSLWTSDGYAREVARWHVPGGRSAVAVGWSGSAPLVRTAGNEVWQVPGCPGCTTDQGIVARLKERLSGCWTTRQLNNVDDDTRRALGVTQCRPLPEPEED